MRNYIPDAGLAGLSTDVSFDVSAFDDIEIYEIVSDIIKERLDPSWAIREGGTIHNKPVIDGDVIYFCCCDKKLYAISTKGKLLWSFETKGVNISTPLIIDNLIVFGSYDQNIYALDKSKGKLAWMFPAEDKIYSRPCTDGERIFFGSRDGNLYCINTKGKLLWKFGTGGPIENHPLLHKGILYFGSNDQNLYALDPETGNMLWRFRTESNIRFSFGVCDDILYLGGMEDTVYGVDRKGRQVFSFMMKNAISQAPLARKDVVYIPSRDENLYAVKTTGDLLWKFKTGDFTGAPALRDGILYFGSGDNNLYAVDAVKGSLKWRFSASGMLPAEPVLHGKVLYMSGWDCNMYALNADTGKLLWKFRTSMGNQSKIDLDSIRPNKRLEVVWSSEPEVVEEKKYSAKELGDYGVLGSDYASGMSKSYMSGKKNYI